VKPTKNFLRGLMLASVAWIEEGIVIVCMTNVSSKNIENPPNQKITYILNSDMVDPKEN
jgi:hypothetical protein